MDAPARTMTTGRMACAILALAYAATPLSVAAKPAPRSAIPVTEDTVPYTFKPRDTLYVLAARYMTHRNDYRVVQTINHIGRATAIRPGTILRIPTRLLRSETLTARIAAFKGDCTVEKDGRGVPVQTGMDILPGMVLQTGAGGFLNLELSNGSRISLPSQSRLQITAMRRFLLTDAVDFDFLVEKGRIETGVAPVGRSGGRYRIRTPIAVSAVRGTTFRVGYDSTSAPSLTEVLEGTVAVGTPASATATPVEKGFGAGVSASGSIATEPLLPSPALLKPGKLQVDPTVTLALTPITDARAYHVQIARDAGFVEIETEATSPDPTLTFADIGNGQWFIRATAIAKSGLEGLPVVYTMRRVQTGLAAEAGKDAQGYRFKWSGSGSGSRVYHFQLRREGVGGVPLVDEPGLSADTLLLSDLPPGQYQWRVGVRQFDNGMESENWLAEQALLVAAPE